MQNIQAAYEAAKAVRQRAYAKYSQFAVGCALKAKGIDELIVGCNVENSSLGGTICAERSACVGLISQYGVQELESIVIVTESDPVAFPCGICRQFLSEFATASTQVYVGNLKGLVKQLNFKELIPYAFTEF